MSPGLLERFPLAIGCEISCCHIWPHSCFFILTNFLSSFLSLWDYSCCGYLRTCLSKGFPTVVVTGGTRYCSAQPTPTCLSSQLIRCEQYLPHLIALVWVEGINKLGVELQWSFTIFFSICKIEQKSSRNPFFALPVGSSSPFPQFSFPWKKQQNEQVLGTAHFQTVLLIPTEHSTSRLTERMAK